MAAYMIAIIKIDDPVRYQADYAKFTPRVIADHGGRMIVRGGTPNVLEGQLPGDRVVVVEFTDRAAVERFYNSSDYQAILGHRLATAGGTVAIVDGLDVASWHDMVSTSRAAG